MSTPAIIRQKDELLFGDVLFNRPINPVLRPRLTIVGGSVKGLKTLSDCYQAAGALGATTELIVPAQIAEFTHGLPVAAYIELDKNKMLKVSSLQDAGANCNLLVLAPGLAESASTQMALEYMLTDAKAVILVSDEALSVVSINPTIFSDTQAIFCLSTKGLITLANHLKIGVDIKPDRGIFNIIDIINTLRTSLRAGFVIYDNNNIIVSEDGDKVGVTSLEMEDIDHCRGYLIGLLAGLVAQYDNDIDQFLPKAMTASYIFRQSLQTPETLVNLKSTLAELG